MTPDRDRDWLVIESRPLRAAREGQALRAALRALHPLTRCTFRGTGEFLVLRRWGERYALVDTPVELAPAGRTWLLTVRRQRARGSHPVGEPITLRVRPGPDALVRATIETPLPLGSTRPPTLRLGGVECVPVGTNPPYRLAPPGATPGPTPQAPAGDTQWPGPCMDSRYEDPLP